MILVTGGTGLVGAHLLLHLTQKSIPIRAIYRTEKSLKKVEKIFSYYSNNALELFSKIEWVNADLNNLPNLENAFKGIDFVYHAAAFISFNERDFEILEKTNVEGTANIVNLCIAHKVKKLCHVSTIGAIDKSIGNKQATEENEWIGQNINVYARTKYSAEMEVWRGTQEGLKVVIVNPGIIIGPGFWNSGSGSFFTNGNKNRNYYPPGGTGFISVKDLVSVMEFLMLSPIENERFIAISENKTYKEILDLIADGLGKRRPKHQLKKWQLHIGASLDWLKSILTGKERILTRNTVKSINHIEIYNTDKLKASYNLPFEPIKETIAFCCTKFTSEVI